MHVQFSICKFLCDIHRYWFLDVIEDFPADNASAATTPTSTLQRTKKDRYGDNRPSLCLTDEPSMEDSGFEPGDIRTYDITRFDSISLDSNPADQTNQSSSTHTDQINQSSSRHTGQTDQSSSRHTDQADQPSAKTTE